MTAVSMKSIPMKTKVYIAGVAAIVVIFLLMGIIHRIYRRDMRRFYKDGFRAGRVVGRDDIITKLDSKGRYKQPVDQLMNPDDTEERLKKMLHE